MRTLLFSLLFASSTVSAQTAGWKITEQRSKKQVDIFFDGNLMTSYCFYDSVMKPVLFPLNSVSGVAVTRGYPVAPRPGDRTDHPHHTGLWLNYESVNGYDFWNNSPAIPLKNRNHYGKIVHGRILSSTASAKEAKLVATATWLAGGSTILTEETTYIFHIEGNAFVIDRLTILRATEKEVSFKDVKDGLLGLRVTNELEMPTKGPLEFIDASGKVTHVDSSKEQTTGMYLTSKMVSGNSAWGTRAAWCTLYGRVKAREMSVTIIDHPENPGYPTYWHARGYGLFAANPLGQEIFSNGKEHFNFKLAPRQSATFRYRVVVAEERLYPSRINPLVTDFSKIH